MSNNLLVRVLTGIVVVAFVVLMVLNVALAVMMMLGWDSDTERGVAHTTMLHTSELGVTWNKGEVVTALFEFQLRSDGQVVDTSVPGLDEPPITDAVRVTWHNLVPGRTYETWARVLYARDGADVVERAKPNGAVEDEEGFWLLEEFIAGTADPTATATNTSVYTPTSWWDDCPEEPTLTAMPTYTPQHTQTPWPTLTPRPAYTPEPTYTVPLTPTCRPLPTATMYATNTPLPDDPLLPTATAYPDSTPRPTYTPWPEQPTRVY